MTAPITPTVGRIVHFYTAGRTTPQAAIIAAVRDAKTVNLTVFRGTGAPEGRVGVPLRQPGEAQPPASTWCEWMPYQVKKATGSESGEEAAGTEQI